MRALVLGATGHLGNAAARELLARGASVVATGRRPAPGANLAGLEIEYASVDDADEGALRSAAEGCELLVDAAGPYRVESFGAAGSGRLAAWARERVRRLAEATRASGATIAHYSSFATRPARRDPLDALQAALARRLHPYFETRRAMEDELLALSSEGRRVVVVNPTCCLGPWDAKPADQCLVPQVLRGRMPATVSHGLNVIDVRDAAKALVDAVERGPWGEAIPLTGHELTIGSLFARICELGGGEPPALNAPAGLAAAAATVTDALLCAAGAETTQAALAALLVLNQAPTAPSRAQRRLRLVPRPLTRTLLDAIEWYRAQGYC